MIKRSAIAVLLLLAPASVVGADIPRDGKLRVPSTEEVARACKERPEVDTDKRLKYCVLSELSGAEGVMEMITGHREAASRAYWDCVDTPEIDSYAMLNACMEQALEDDPTVTNARGDDGRQTQTGASMGDDGMIPNFEDTQEPDGSQQ